MQKWEYKTIMISAYSMNLDGKSYNSPNPDLDLDVYLIGNTFNKLGTDGWELVTALDKNDEGHVIAIFKRPCE